MPVLARPPDPNPKTPRLRCPPGAIDCHVHVFGPKEVYAFDPGSKYISDDRLPEEQIALWKTLGLSRAVIVSGGGYGPNTSHLEHTLAAHPNRFLGVALLPDDATPADIRLLDTGRVWVKLSGPMRCTPEEPLYPSVTPMARALAAHRPDRLIWGSDWPHLNMNGRTMPNDGDLIDLLLDWAPDEATRNRILADNPARLFRLI